MDVAEFERVLRVGLGRVVLHLQSHDAAVYRDVIMEACTRNWQWDTEESTREQYLLDIITLTGEPQAYRDAILNAIASIAQKDEASFKFSPANWDAWQLASLARLFASKGDSQAHHALRELVAHQPTDDWLVGELFKLETVRTLPFLANVLGARLRDGDEDARFDCAHAHYLFESEFGEDTTRDALAVAGANDQHVAAFLEAVEAYRAIPEPSAPNYNPRGLDYAGIVRWMNDYPLPRYPFANPWAIWGKNADDSDLLRAAEALITLPDNDPLLRRHVQIFARRTFPLDPNRLIDLSRLGKNEFPGLISEANDEDVLAVSAFFALENVRHPDVRAFILELLDTNQWPARAINVLVGNFQDGDLPIINEALLSANDSEARHHISMAIKSLYQIQQPIIGIDKTLLLVFEHGPCGFCRYQAVRWLMEMNALPNWIRQECYLDANSEIRELLAVGSE